MSDSVKEYLALTKDIWNTFGLPTILLAVALLLYIGVIPSPLSEASINLDKIKFSIDRHLERDREVLFYLKEMCVSNAKLAKTPVEDCLWRP